MGRRFHNSRNDVLSLSLQLKHYCDMLSNCTVSKTLAIIKICRCLELTNTLNTWWKRFLMIIMMLCCFETFTSSEGSMQNFSKHYSKCKTVSVKFRKTFQEKRLPILKFWQGKTHKHFLNFLTSKNIFITLNIPGIYLKYFWNRRGMFLQYSGNITSWLLEFAKRSTFVIIKTYTLTQKQLFHRELFKKS